AADADESGKLEVGPSQLLARPAADRRVLDRRSRRVAAVNEVASAVVVALAARHAADEREAIGALGGQGQVVGDLHSLDARADGLEGPSLARAWFRIERIDVARTAIEPEPHAALRVAALGPSRSRPEQRRGIQTGQTGETEPEQ